MYSINYPAPTLGTILSHYPQRQMFVRDTAASHGEAESDDLQRLLTRARISSGDYIVTLATELDKIAQNLEAVRAPEMPEVERIVTELMYVNQNYKLVKKA